MDRADKELTFTIHGIGHPNEKLALIPASVFQTKLREILAALRRADATLNRHRPHRYLISKLQPGSATVGILEWPANPQKPPNVSSVAAVVECADAVYRSNFVVAHRFANLVKSIAEICAGAGEKFSHIDMEAESEPAVRADDFLFGQANRFLLESRLGKRLLQDPEKNRLYVGESRESYDGEIKEVDLRGRLARGKLVLSGVHRELDCVFRNVGIDQLREYLDRRVWAEGQAIFDGSSPLPGRFEIDRIRLIGAAGDLTLWRGQLEAAEPPDWDPEFG